MQFLRVVDLWITDLLFDFSTCTFILMTQIVLSFIVQLQFCLAKHFTILISLLLF